MFTAVVWPFSVRFFALFCTTMMYSDLALQSDHEFAKLFFRRPPHPDHPITAAVRASVSCERSRPGCGRSCDYRLVGVDRGPELAIRSSRTQPAPAAGTNSWSSQKMHLRRAKQRSCERASKHGEKYTTCRHFLSFDRKFKRLLTRHQSG